MPSLKKPKKADLWVKSVLDSHGWENCNKHVNYLCDQHNVDILPSLITFSIYIKRNHQLGQKEKAEQAESLIKIYQDVDDILDVLPIYNQEKISRKELHALSKKLKCC